MTSTGDRPTVSLQVLDGDLAVCRLPPDAPAPMLPDESALFSVTRTADELSVVCSTPAAPRGSHVEPGWRALSVVGPLDFGLTGILASIAEPLAGARVSIFALSTFDTDYVLVRASAIDDAIAALEGAGHVVRRRQAG